MVDQTPDSFPRASARTQKFTRGAPRSLHLDPTGSRLLFVRSSNGTDPVGALWSMDVVTGAETLLADPRALLADGDEQLSPAERARRERSREGGGGIVGLRDRPGRDGGVLRAVQPAVGDRPAGDTRELPAVGAVIDPRPDPTGTWVAYAAEGGLHLVGVDGSGARTLAAAEKHEVAWGVAEFVAAEEMDRYRGYWWAPDGSAVLAARVDESPVPLWYIADPSQPSLPPAQVRYPVAGSADAEVTLHLLGLDGARTDVEWDRSAYPYLVRASWSAAGAVLQVMSRDQKRALVLAVDPSTGATSTLAEQSDPVWIDAVVGVPALLPDGRLVTTAERDGARRLVVDGNPVTGTDIQVTEVLVGRRGRGPARRHRRPDPGSPLALVPGRLLWSGSPGPAATTPGSPRATRSWWPPGGPASRCRS